MGSNVVERKKHFDRTLRNFDDKFFLNPVLTLRFVEILPLKRKTSLASSDRDKQVRPNHIVGIFQISIEIPYLEDHSS